MVGMIRRNQRFMVSILVLACWATVARAIVPAGKPVSATTSSGSASEAGAVGKRDFPGAGTGWMVNAGYFFKDTMFYSNGRGGGHVNVGRLIPLPKRFGLWVGVGGFQARGTQETTGGDGNRYRTTFDSEILYTDLGLVTPLTPFPVCLVVYWHSTGFRNEGITGPLTGTTLTGDHSAIRVGFNVHLLFEYFLSGARKPPRGLGLVVGWVGFLEPSGQDLVTRDGAGNAVTLRKWKPLRGESLRVGLEYEF